MSRADLLISQTIVENTRDKLIISTDRQVTMHMHRKIQEHEHEQINEFTFPSLRNMHTPPLPSFSLLPLFASHPPYPLAVVVTVLVAVAVRVCTTSLVLVTVVSAGPFVIKQLHAELICFGPPRPSEMLMPPGSGRLMSIWRLRTGSSAGHETS